MRSWPAIGFPDWSAGAAGAAAIDLGLLVLILKLDADYLEGGGGDQPEALRTLAASPARGRRCAAELEKRQRDCASRGFPGWEARAARVAAIAAGHAHVRWSSALPSAPGGHVAGLGAFTMPARAQGSEVVSSAWVSGSWPT